MQSPSPSPPAGPSPGALIRGKYRLNRRIGEGSMGVVWAAYNEATSREVAIKLLVRPDPQLRERMLREARACGAVQHRNVVDIYDADETEGGDPFLVMPLLAGETLSAMLKRKRRLEPPEAARIARDIARGLAAAHELGIVHRDLKPANIFLLNDSGEKEPIVKILDFGVSKILTGGQEFRTAMGLLVGSPPYMSPEQVRARGDIDHRVDIWTLGVVLFEMLAGVRPIQGKSHEILLRVVDGEIPSVAQFVRQIEPGLAAVVAHCLQRDRERRPRSAADVAAALEPFVLPAAPQHGSSPDLRYEAPGSQAQSPRFNAAPAVEQPPQALGGTVRMVSQPDAAPWGAADEATTVPRGQPPKNPMLGDSGTLRMSPLQAAAYRLGQAPSAPAAGPVAPNRPVFAPMPPQGGAGLGPAPMASPPGVGPAAVQSSLVEAEMLRRSNPEMSGASSRGRNLMLVVIMAAIVVGLCLAIVGYFVMHDHG